MPANTSVPDKVKETTNANVDRSERSDFTPPNNPGSGNVELHPFISEIVRGPSATARSLEQRRAESVGRNCGEHFYAALQGAIVKKR
jgi:hypothetical protein